MAIDQVSDASQVTPRHPPNDQVLPTTTEATDSTDPDTDGSFSTETTVLIERRSDSERHCQWLRSTLCDGQLRANA